MSPPIEAAAQSTPSSEESNAAHSNNLFNQHVRNFLRARSAFYPPLPPLRMTASGRIIAGELPDTNQPEETTNPPVRDARP